MNVKCFPLTRAQQEIYFISKLLPVKSLCNIATSIVFEGNADRELLIKAAYAALERCESLSIRLIREKKEICQYMYHEQYQIGIWDFSADSDDSGLLSAANREARSALFKYNHRLYNLKFIITHDGMYGFFFNVHHIIADSLSISVFWSDLLSIYTALKNGQSYPKAPAPYMKGVEAEEAYYSSPRYAADREYWTRYYSSHKIPTFAHPTGKQYLELSRKRTKNPDSVISSNSTLLMGGRIDCYIIPADLVSRITSFCTERHISVYSVLQCAKLVYYSAVNDVDSLAYVLLSANRSTWIEKTSGGTRVNINTLISTLDKTASFSANCKSVAADILEAMLHMRFPFLEGTELCNKIYGLKSTDSFYSEATTFQNYRLTPPDGLKLHSMLYSTGHSMYVSYMTIMDDDSSGALRIYLDCMNVHVSKQLSSYMFDCFIRILTAGVSDPDRQLNSIMQELPPMPDLKFKLPPLLIGLR